MAALALLAVLAAAAAADAAPRAPALAVIEPRSFGYFLGDVLRREVVLTLPPGARLEPGSLPRQGPVNYWLELRSVDVGEREREDGSEVRIALAYQAFYSALDPRRLTIPGFALKVSQGEGSVDINVPEWSFVMSPIRELFPGKEQEGAAVAMRPDRAPPSIPTARERTALLGAAATALAALVLLARHLAWGPFRRRPGRPFTEAARFLRCHMGQLAGEGGYRAALLKLHRAFDAAAGRRVLPDDLQTFLADHPEFAPLGSDIRRLFVSSRTAFYGNDVAQARAAMPLEAITELSARLGAAERRAA